jgi:hypothetical protein
MLRTSEAVVFLLLTMLYKLEYQETQIRDTNQKCAQMRLSPIWKNETRPHHRGAELTRWRVKRRSQLNLYPRRARFRDKREMRAPIAHLRLCK